MENFGIKPDQIIFQIVNFFIILVVLKKFVYKYVIAFVKSQKEQNDEFDRLSKEINNQKNSFSELSNKQKAELQKIYIEDTEKAKKEAHSIVENAKELAKKEGTRILAEYNTEALRMKDTIIKSAKDEIYSNALNITEQLIKSSLTQEQKDKLMDMAFERLKINNKENE